MSGLIRGFLTALWRIKEFFAWCLDLDRPAWVFFPALFGVGASVLFVILLTFATVSVLTHPIIGIFAVLALMMAAPMLAYWLRDGGK